MTEEPHKGVDWVLEQLENISAYFEGTEEPIKEAISDLAIIMFRMVQHINNLYEVLGNMVADPEKLKELKDNGYQGLYS